MLAIATSHGVDAAAVLLMWALQQGIAVVPKSSQPARMRSNFDGCKGWKLSDEEMSTLDSLDQNGAKESRLCWGRDPLKDLDFD